MVEAPDFKSSYWIGSGGAKASLTRKLTVFGYVYQIRGTRVSSKGKLVKWEVDYMELWQAEDDLNGRRYTKDTL